MRILQVSTTDLGGGAERVALDLHRSFRALGHDATLLVGWKRTAGEGVESLEEMKGGLYPLRRFFGRSPRLLGLELLFDSRFRRWLRGKPAWDVVHFHNACAGYLPLGFLAEVPASARVFWTLHDCWAFTGHCAHPLGCPGWLSGCRRCPDIRRYPRIRRDGASWNLALKKRAFARPGLVLVSPSRWLAGMLGQSVLAGVPRRVIPNGVSPRLYFPGDRGQARLSLSLPPDRVIALFAATEGLDNPWKGGQVVREFIRRHGDRCLTVVVGGKPETGWGERARFVPFQEDMGPWYRAADFLLYPTRADTFGLVPLEAMACGLPSMASGAGGVPEVLEDRVTSLVAPEGDEEAFLEGAGRLLGSADLRAFLSRAGAGRFSRLFTLDRMASSYLDLYGGIGRGES